MARYARTSFAACHVERLRVRHFAAFAAFLLIASLLLILSRFLLRRLQVVHDLLQAGDAAFQTLDLPVRGIELLLMVSAEFCDRLLQEIDIALQATGPPLHGLFDGADFNAGNILGSRLS